MSQIINSIKTDKFKRWTLVTMVTSKNNQKCKVNALHMYIPQLLGLNLSFCTETPCTRGLGRKSFKCALKMVLASLWRANAADVFKRSLRIHKLIIFRNHFCIQWCTMIASFSDFTNELLMEVEESFHFDPTTSFYWINVARHQRFNLQTSQFNFLRGYRCSINGVKWSIYCLCSLMKINK